MTGRIIVVVVLALNGERDRGKIVRLLNDPSADVSDGRDCFTVGGKCGLFTSW